MEPLTKENRHATKYPFGKTVKQCYCLKSCYCCDRCRGMCIFSKDFEGLMKDKPGFGLNKYLDPKYFKSELQAMKDCINASLEGTETSIQEDKEDNKCSLSDDEVDKKTQRSRKYKEYITEQERTKKTSATGSPPPSSVVLEMMEWYHQQDSEVKKYFNKIHRRLGSELHKQSVVVKGNQATFLLKHSHAERKFKADKITKKNELMKSMKDQAKGYY